MLGIHGMHHISYQSEKPLSNWLPDLFFLLEVHYKQMQNHKKIPGRKLFNFFHKVLIPSNLTALILFFVDNIPSAYYIFYNNYEILSSKEPCMAISANNAISLGSYKKRSYRIRSSRSEIWWRRIIYNCQKSSSKFFRRNRRESIKFSFYAGSILNDSAMILSSIIKF